MKKIKGPGIFLAQFMSDEAPFHNLESAAKTMAAFGYRGIQIPTWDIRCVDLEKLATSELYATEIKGIVQHHNLEITELSAHLQGQLVAVHPAYNPLYDAFAPNQIHGNSAERQTWAEQQIRWTIEASSRLGLGQMAAFSGALLWPFTYPWPQRPQNLVETGFSELAKRWKPLLDFADEKGIDICFELHPGEDLHDGITFERFLKATGNHIRAKILYDPSHFVLQCLDYVEFINIYHEHIKMFHVKDAEFNPSGKSGVYGGYSNWIDRPGRFRSPGDGQVDFKRIFSLLTQYDYDGWAIVEWECVIKNAMQGASEGAKFVTDQIIEVTSNAFDDFASSTKTDQLSKNKRLLGF